MACINPSHWDRSQVQKKMRGAFAHETTYTVAVGAGVDANLAADFGSEVARVLDDNRGWKKYGYSFREVSKNGDMLLFLATPEDSAALCNDVAGLSCWSPKQRRIVFHEGNWRTGGLRGGAHQIINAREVKGAGFGARTGT